jgi:outer membrane murein-binding lipoprotein Lpp
MPEQRPTNERLGELLDELLSEVRELRKGQERLADDVQKLAERSER